MKMRSASSWPVVPICELQRKDVGPEHLLEGGLYRNCDVWTAGGGYDRFPQIAASRLGGKGQDYRNHFIVQTYGCPLDCTYCYVTPEGIWGEPANVTTPELVEAFKKTRAQVFHLMGGAPAIYLEKWPELLDSLGDGVAFHSDFLLVEGLYSVEVVNKIARPNTLYAVSVKGLTPREWSRVTGKEVDWTRWLENLSTLLDAGVSFYLTFTGKQDKSSLSEFKASLRLLYGPGVLEDSYNIEVKHYQALDS